MTKNEKRRTATAKSLLKILRNKLTDKRNTANDNEKEIFNGLIDLTPCINDLLKSDN